MPVFTNPKDSSQTVTSPFETLQDAITFLEARKDRISNFALDLLSRSMLSPSQVFWIHKIASDIVNPPAKKPMPTVADFSNVVAMIQHAYDNGAKRLKIRILLEDDRRITLAPYAPNGSLVAVYVQGSGDWGTRYGRIFPNGDFQPFGKMDQMVFDKVLEFAKNPLEVAKEYGIIMKECCFCGKDLTDARSIQLSYGPVCARKYNLEVPY